MGEQFGWPKLRLFLAVSISLVVILGVSAGSAADTAVGDGRTRPMELRCEYLKDPLGIDTTKPRFSWMIASDRRGERQTAYRVLVASSTELLAKDKGDSWDSGRVESDQSVLVEYAGAPLASGDRLLLEGAGMEQR